MSKVMNDYSAVVGCLAGKQGSSVTTLFLLCATYLISVSWWKGVLCRGKASSFAGFVMLPSTLTLGNDSVYDSV